MLVILLQNQQFRAQKYIYFLEPQNFRALFIEFYNRKEQKNKEPTQTYAESTLFILSLNIAGKYQLLLRNISAFTYLILGLSLFHSSVAGRTPIAITSSRKAQRCL